MNNNVRKAAPVVLSILASAGVIVTSILVAKEAESANKKIREAKEKNDKKEVAKAFIKGYYPAIIAGTATISSIVVGTIISKRTEMSLTATALVLDTTLRKYKDKLKEVFGDKANIIGESISKDDYKKELERNEKKIKELQSGEFLYYEEHIGFFKARPENIESAVLSLNEEIVVKKGCYCLREFVKDSGAKLTGDSPIDDVSFGYGWYREYLSEVSIQMDDYSEFNAFIHIKRKPFYDANGELVYYKLTFDIDPVLDVEKQNAIARGEDYEGYNAGDIDEFERIYGSASLVGDEDAEALSYDELKDLKPKEKKKVIVHAKTTRKPE